MLLYTVWMIRIKLKTKRYHNVGPVLKPNNTIVERDTSIPHTYIYMTAHFARLV